MLLMGSHTRLRCYKRVRFVDVVIVLHSLVTYCFGKVLFCDVRQGWGKVRYCLVTCCKCKVKSCVVM